VDELPGNWNLHSSDAEEREFDFHAQGLKRAFTLNHGKATAMIQYHDDDDEDEDVGRRRWVGLSVLMTPQMTADMAASSAVSASTHHSSSLVTCTVAWNVVSLVL
jgi:hypothetical protein